MAGSNLTPQQLRSLLDYDPSTGILSWLVTRSGKRAGDHAGTKRVDGYLSISVNGRLYLAHRLAWFHFYGEWPTNIIDHIDGNKSNNAIANLRNATKTTNAQNMRKGRKDNKVGMLGVSFDQPRGMYKAQICVNGRNRFIGRYATPELAQEAYLAAKRKHHEGCEI